MEKSSEIVRDVRLELEDAIQTNKKRLDLLQEEVASLVPEIKISRSHIEKANSTVALEILRHKLAILQAGPNASYYHNSCKSKCTSVLLSCVILKQFPYHFLF